MKNEAFAPTPELLAKMDAWWRAANYLSACQLYLLDDPLLRRRLTERDIKKKIVGHWGTVPGQNFIYTHLNRVINEYDLDMIYLSGPGHGGNAMVAQDYLDGSYTDVYPNITRDAAGMQRLFKQFSFPGGIPSHVAPETPGSIHEGGELGYSLAHAFGAVMDNPDLIAACVVGDGEAETGPLATSWQLNKFINPKTDGAVLPIRGNRKVAFIGRFAEKPRYQGGGSSHINASAVTSALDAARVNGTDVVYAEGFPADRDETDEAKFAAAVEAARAADAAIIFAGLPDSFESEGYDRSHMRLPECQDRLIARVAAVQPNTVVVLHNGSPVECPWAESVNAVLEMYLGGQGVGAAADALLYGDANPSGRLPETFPYQLEDNPSHLNFPGDGKNVEYAEGVFVGYRYYDKKKMAVRWPFGHGLSYTTFEYSNVRVSADVLNDGGTVTVYADIKNTGDRAGREVVQLYVADRTGTAGRPEKELKGFAKVALEPGETKTVELSVDARSLSWYSEALGGWYAAPGRYELLVGHSSRDIRGAAAVEFRTEKLLPFHVDENTTVGELLADPHLRYGRWRVSSWTRSRPRRKIAQMPQKRRFPTRWPAR